MTSASMFRIGARLEIPRSELRFSFVRSSGPGGQNVNKVNTKAVLRWGVAASPSVSEAIRRRFMQQNRRRVTAGGEIIITSQRFRDQGRNVADCLAKLRDLLATAAVAPTIRKKTKPSRAATRRRLEEKKSRSDTKRLRKKPRLDD